MENPFRGVFFHRLGGLSFGSFYVPYKKVRKWSWETCWLVGGVFSRFITPSARRIADPRPAKRARSPMCGHDLVDVFLRDEQNKNSR